MSDPSTGKLEDSAALELSGIILIIFIMLLFILVLLVIIFRLFSVRHRLWNHHTDAPTGSDLPTLQQRQGLDPSVLKSIKVVEFSAAEDQLGLECSVCLCQVSQGEKTRYLPKCNHGFHMQCIDIWFHSHSTCPLCRDLVSVDAPDSQPPTVSSSTPSSSGVAHLAIDITIIRTEEEDPKSPVTVTPTAALYRSLSRLLSRNS